MDSSKLESLLERVKAADGADPILDFDLYEMAMLWGGGYMDPRARVAPSYTSSVDASLALVDQVLPGCAFRIGRDEDGHGKALLYRGNAEWQPYSGAEMYDVWTDFVRARTLPLATLTALLTSLVTREAKSPAHT